MYKVYPHQLQLSLQMSVLTKFQLVFGYHTSLDGLLMPRKMAFFLPHQWGFTLSFNQWQIYIDIVYKPLEDFIFLQLIILS